MQPHPIRAAWESGDPDAVAACFTPDGVYHSPVIGEVVGFRGRAAIAELMRVVYEVTSETEFTDQLDGPGCTALGFRTRFGRRPVRGVLWLDVTPDGEIHELWTFVRPLRGVVAVATTIGPALACRESTVLGPAARAGVAPLAGMAGLVDRIGAVLIRRVNDRSG